jgi:peptidoglycan hydrolase-like amidase
MRVDMVNQVVRSVVLLGLLLYFTVSLILGLIEDEHRKGNWDMVKGGTPGGDPGIRVRLDNRQPPEPIPTWDKIDIIILQPVDVVTPSYSQDPNYHLTLQSGVLHIQPDTNSGLLLSAKEWGKEYSWGVSEVRIQPSATDPQPGLVASGQRAGPAERDPGLFESSAHDAVFAVNSLRYRGSLAVVWHSAKDVEAINHLPMEAYLEGVVAVEMSPSYPLQALKAQAIASRGYALAHQKLSLDARREYDLTDGSDDQGYRGTGNGNEAVHNAVSDTRGMVMVVNHTSVFAPLFCASSGGYTESIDEVLPGSTDVDYKVPMGLVMKAQPDRFCQLGVDGLGYAASHWSHTTTILPKELELSLAKLLAPENRPVGFIHAMRVGKRDPKSGRVLSVRIFQTLSGEPIELRANSFRMLVGPNVLRSTLWTVDSPRKIEDADGKRNLSYEITSIGYGHGVGMSQVSAWEMANENYSAADILRYFYHDIEFTNKW